jgi:adenylosuccinate synthase
MMRPGWLRSRALQTERKGCKIGMWTARIIADLGFGDSGKGLITDFLCREHGVNLVVKYTGGPQATHTVMLADGRHHRFSQFGSGTFLPNCRTHLTRHVLVEPFAMMNEADALTTVGVTDAMDRVSVDERCVLITPWHWLANKIRELMRGGGRHGSCGMGIGETKRMIADGGPWMTVRDLGRPAHGLLKHIRTAALSSVEIPRSNVTAMGLYECMLDENVSDLMDFYNDWARRIQIGGSIVEECVFEGAQGVLLDEKHGFAPYNTWSNTTFENALEVCLEWSLDPIKIGVLRTYMTRHGAGPFVTEDNLKYNFPDHNSEHPWQGKFRQGAFDMVMAGYAVMSAGYVDEIALTHMDRAEDWEYCSGYDRPPWFTAEGLHRCKPVLRHADPIRTIEETFRVPVSITSYGPTAEHVKVRKLK